MQAQKGCNFTCAGSAPHRFACSLRVEFPQVIWGVATSSLRLSKNARASFTISTSVGGSTVSQRTNCAPTTSFLPLNGLSRIIRSSAVPSGLYANAPSPIGNKSSTQSADRRPIRPLPPFQIDHDKIAAWRGSRHPIGTQHPQVRAAGALPVVISVEQPMAVDEGVERRRDPDTTFGLRRSQLRGRTMARTARRVSYLQKRYR